MKVEEVRPGVWMFVGDTDESVATAFLDGNDALLVDSLASVEDARWLQRILCDDMGSTVRVIAATHFMGDHMAGLSVFGDAITIAHRYHRHAFLSQNRRVDASWREPRVVFDKALSLRWGPHDLHFVHNPGKTMDHVSVDAPTADLVCAGDNIVGNIVYLSKADPALMRAAIVRMRQMGRGTVIGGHIGRFSASVLDNAIHYLDRLQDAVVRIRTGMAPRTAEEAIGAIPIEACLAAQCEAGAFERTWHQHNLDAIVQQSIFALDAALSGAAVSA